MGYNHRKKPLPDFPPAPTETADRVAYVEELMRTLQWERGKTGPALAKAWDFSTHAVDRWASEAWRKVKAEIEDPDEMLRAKQKVTAALEFVIDGAIEEIQCGVVMQSGVDRQSGEPIMVTLNPNDARRSIIAAGKTFADIAGAMAPTKVKVEGSVGQLTADELRAQVAQAIKVLAADDPGLLVTLAEAVGGDATPVDPNDPSATG